MSNKIIQSILSLLASVLHLGNIKFHSKQIDGAEGSIIKDKTPLQHFCNITKIDSNLLIQNLTFRELQTMAPGGKVKKNLILLLLLLLLLLLFLFF